ncbi:MAG TPA: hypothetical protein G4O12_08185 [Dehalococcoidia bacterium]|jgi:hypothetical protein|nr:hypothetical protein [Dehalococcoidia bacterium]
MPSDKKCVICGKPGIARVNGKAWLCAEHAIEATKLSLVIGAPVVWARRGDPQYLMMPIGIHRN